MKETLRGKIAAWLWLEEIAGEEERIKKQKNKTKKTPSLFMQKRFGLIKRQDCNQISFPGKSGRAVKTCFELGIQDLKGYGMHRR